MNFFQSFTDFFDKFVFDYMSGEILLIAMLSLMAVIFTAFLITHLFSKDVIAIRKLKGINKYLMFSRYDAYTENFILKRFKTAPYRFYENYLNKIEAMSFSACVPYYLSSVKFGKKITVCLYEVICTLALIMGLVLFENQIILTLSGALLIPAFGIIFSVILSFGYDFIKDSSFHKLELKFAEFLKFLKPKISAYNKVQNPTAEKENKTLKSFDDLMAKVKELKLKGAKMETAKQLANDLAVAKNDCPNSRENDILTDALVDVLNIINDKSQNLENAAVN